MTPRFPDLEVLEEPDVVVPALLAVGDEAAVESFDGVIEEHIFATGDQHAGFAVEIDASHAAIKSKQGDQKS